MKKKISYLIVAFLVIFSLFLSACSSNSASSSNQNSSGDQKFKASKPRIAFFSAGASNTYLQTGIKAAEDTAKKHGADIDIFDGQFDALKQYEQVQNAIASNKYDAFLVEAVDGRQLCNIITKDAYNKGIKSAVINATMCGVKNWHPGTITFVGGQQYNVYDDIVKEISKENPNGGEIAGISGPQTGTNAINMKKALDKLVKDNPQWKLVAFPETDYTSNKGFEVTQNIIQSHPNIKVIFSNYSGVTVGVAQAVKAAKRDDIKIYDFGGDQWSFKAIQDGSIQMSTIMLPYQEVQRGIEAIFDSFAGKSVPKFIDLSKDPILPGTPYVSKDTIQKFKDKGLPEY